MDPSKPTTMFSVADNILSFGVVVFMLEFPAEDPEPIPAPVWKPTIDHAATGVLTTRSGFRDGDGPRLLFQGRPVAIDHSDILSRDLHVRAVPAIPS